MKRVTFLYKGSLPDGGVFDDGTNEAHQITLGWREVMKPLEDALDEMELGEERTIAIAAKDAYGDYDPQAVQRVPTFKIPNGENIPAGEMILWKSPRNPRPIPAKVLSVVNQVAELDFNHPLAGKDIVYWIKLVSIDSDS
jgi:peptidylprolyl isomerase